jgi:hypothetical protein
VQVVGTAGEAVRCGRQDVVPLSLTTSSLQRRGPEESEGPVDQVGDKRLPEFTLGDGFASRSRQWWRARTRHQG